MKAKKFLLNSAIFIAISVTILTIIVAVIEINNKLM